MLTMQVPAGKPLAGMVHHKVHDHEWTGLPLDPAADDKIRELHRPSTAATLNLAAVAAQGSRLFERYDRAFSRELLKAARHAWTAANANPALYAPAADGNSGGGPYDDSDVTDEFYWAAAELYLTTGERQFKNAVARLAAPRARPVLGRRVRLADDGTTRPARSGDARPPPARTSGGSGAGCSRAPTRSSPCSANSRGDSRTPRPAISGRGARPPRSSTTWWSWRRPTTSAATTGTATPCSRAWTSSSAATR